MKMICISNITGGYWTKVVCSFLDRYIRGISKCLYLISVLAREFSFAEKVKYLPWCTVYEMYCASCYINVLHKLCFLIRFYFAVISKNWNASVAQLQKWKHIDWITIYACLIVTYLLADYAAIFLLYLVHVVQSEGKPSKMHLGLCQPAMHHII